jgi:hypothetical protein
VAITVGSPGVLVTGWQADTNRLTNKAAQVIEKWMDLIFSQFHGSVRGKWIYSMLNQYRL